ncbi:MAG: DUF494 family protein [Myxococcota bacterium]
MSTQESRLKRPARRAARTREQQSDVVVEMTEPAHLFLKGLRERGVVDERMEEDIINRLMVLNQPEISVVQLKKVAAIVIFEQQFELKDEDYGIYDEEWRLLFN